jgi:hypothetical protein
VPIWQSIEWDALATFTTGLAAVGAAIYIGRRQINISAAQAEIQAKAEARGQLITESEQRTREQSLRLALLDRRISVIEEFRELFTVWSMEGKLARHEIERLRLVAQKALLIYPQDTTKATFDCVIALSDALRFYERAEKFRNGDQSTFESLLQKAFDAEDVAVRLMPVIMEDIQKAARVLF